VKVRSQSEDGHFWLWARGSSVRGCSVMSYGWL
jgi:hypothetical protein